MCNKNARLTVTASCFLFTLSKNIRKGTYKKGTLGSNTLSDINTLVLKYQIFLFGLGTKGLIRKVNLSFFADLNQILLEGNWPITFPDYFPPLALYIIFYNLVHCNNNLTTAPTFPKVG